MILLWCEKRSRCPRAQSSSSASDSWNSESFSATVARLIEEGAELVPEGRVPSYVGAFDGPGDLSSRDEEILREIFAKL